MREDLYVKNLFTCNSDSGFFSLTGYRNLLRTPLLLPSCAPLTSLAHHLCPFAYLMAPFLCSDTSGKEVVWRLTFLRG